MTAPDGLVVVDKPGGMTSHDVVACMRRLAGTRKVGHAGTLDPTATGVLLVGLGRATRLLGHLALTDKTYGATVRLGAATTTDDAAGEVTATADAAAVTDAEISTAVVHLTGDLDQIPSSVSAVKVDGQRAYRRVRAGEHVELEPRRVQVRRFDVLSTRRDGGFIDLDVVIECTTGTYVRALARDLGSALMVGGHLTALRRTRVGPYDVSQAHTLEQLGHELVVLPLADVAATSFPRRDVGAAAAQDVSFGRPLPATGTAGPVAVFGPDGAFLALMADAADGLARPVAVFTG